jgi:hypothetical protein
MRSSGELQRSLQWTINLVALALKVELLPDDILT